MKLADKLRAAAPFARLVLEHSSDKRLRDAANMILAADAVCPRAAERVLLESARRSLNLAGIYELIWGRPPPCSPSAIELLRAARELVAADDHWLREELGVQP